MANPKLKKAFAADAQGTITRELKDKDGNLMVRLTVEYFPNCPNEEVMEMEMCIMKLSAEFAGV